MAKRTSRFKVSCTPQEDEILEQLADQAGIPKARYVREVALGDRPQLAANYEVENGRSQTGGIPRGEVKTILKEFRSHGRNWNQVAKYLNTFGRVEQEMFRDTLGTGKQLYSKLLDLLAR